MALAVFRKSTGELMMVVKGYLNEAPPHSLGLSEIEWPRDENEWKWCPTVLNFVRRQQEIDLVQP